MRGVRIAWAALAFMAAPAVAQAWNAGPWVADLEAMRAAFRAKYANLDWMEQERGLPLDRSFDAAVAAVRQAGDDGAARAVLDRMVVQIGDGHVALRWPVKGGPTVSGSVPRSYATPSALCAGLGYEAGVRPGVAAGLPGRVELAEPGEYRAATVRMDGATLGIVRIPAFMPQAFPTRCEAVVAARPALLNAPCEEACQDAVLTGAYQALTREFDAALGRLRAAGAEVLLVDLSDNGGGSEWAEALARMLSPRPRRSAATGFVRGPHWARQWTALADRLRQHARSARGAERVQLLVWAAEAERGRREAELPDAPGRPRVVRLGYATGLLAEGDAALAAKPYGPYLFSAGQPAYPFRRGAWDGPVIVLVNQRTYSAAEQVAALLQDNRVAVILGERTGGAGCGHTAGGTPTTLPHSKAVLELPDCVRFRADGSNEVNGVVPDVPTGQRGTDSPAFAARLVAARLPEAVAAARRLWAAKGQP